MSHLLVKPVIPGFLINGEAPALGGTGFFDRVVISSGAVGLDGIAVEQVGISDALRPVHLRAIIHASKFRPAFLRHSDDSIFELDNQNRVVLTGGLVAMDLGAHLRVNRTDFRPAEHPAEKFNRVATHVHRHAAAGALHVPEVRRVRTVMFLRLL